LLYRIEFVLTANCRYSDEITHYEVQKYRAMGLSQESFVQELMPTFRYSLYVVKGPVDGQRGRRKLSADVFAGNHTASALAHALTVVDRIGNLAVSFQNMEQLAEKQQSTSIEFAHYAMPGDARFNLVLSPLICPCLRHLSARPTIAALHEMNRDFARKRRREFDEVEAQSLLVALLSYLEKLNMITLEYSEVPPGAGGRGRPFRVESTDDRAGGYSGTRQEEPFTSGTGEEATDRKVGGLKVRSPTEREQISRGTNEKQHAASPSATPASAGTPAAPPRSSSTTATAGASGPAKAADAKSLNAAEQVSRMRALGYSDDMIEQLLGFAPEPEPELASIPETGTTVDTSDEKASVSLTGDVSTMSAEEAATNMAKARDVIDLLKRFTQVRAAEAEAKAALLTSDGASASVSMDAAQREHAADAALAASASNAEEARTAPVTFKMDRSGGSGSSPELIVSGGLKLPSTNAMETKSGSPGLKKDSASTASSLSGNTRTSATRAAADQKDKQTLRAEDIIVPKLLTPETVEQSPRSLSCLPR
jgi:hypothetical protein